MIEVIVAPTDGTIAIKLDARRVVVWIGRRFRRFERDNLVSIAALADRRVRGEFKAWRDRFANSPRKADFAWTVLARVLSFARDRGVISVNPCEKGGRLYVADRRDNIWSEDNIAALLSTASDNIPAALMLAIWTGQRQGDLLRLPWSALTAATFACSNRRPAAE